MIKHLNKTLLGLLVCIVFAQLSAIAQETTETATATSSQIIEPDSDFEEAEFVTINVEDANISEVLKAYSLQTGQSIVVGPDVVSGNVNVRLNDIPWGEALDVILKPYGFGYRVVGDTIVINKLENIIIAEGIEPLVSKVFKLNYLDAYDIKEVAESLLSARGKFTILSTKGLPGWEFGGSGVGGGAASESGVRQRKEREQIQKSKTFVITDVPSIITQVGLIVEEMDIMPEQVLIEATFLEINTDNGSQIGFDYITGIENVEALVQSGGSSSALQPAALAELNRVLNMTTGFVDPMQTGAAGSLSQAQGLRLSHVELGGQGYDMLFNMIAQDDNANVLSSPRLLTLNNQEAAILVGTKYPIIESNNSSGGSGGAGNTSTSLDYYENIGVQLNVIPQVCEDGRISMIVHPAVSEIEGFQSGIVFSGGEQASGTQYPILRIREAETQVMIKSGNTAVIGGLQIERDSVIIEKIPLLGDIPFIGRLFRNETLRKEKIDLVIFVKATVVEKDGYEQDSQAAQEDMQAVMRLEQNEEADFKVADEEVEVSEAEGAEILALVESLDYPSAATNAPVAATNVSFAATNAPAAE